MNKETERRGEENKMNHEDTKTRSRQGNCAPKAREDFTFVHSCFRGFLPSPRLPVSLFTSFLPAAR